MIHMNALQRRRVGVDEREAPQIEVHGAGDVPGGEILGWPQIDEERLGVPFEDLVESGGRGEQLGVGKTGHGRIV